MRIILFFLGISVLLTSCNHTCRKVENIRSFAKVYGYVRWFYPGDEAVQTDWDKFAVYGIQKVENARNKKELQQILLELFKPIAPAIEIDNEKQDERFNIKTIIPKDIKGLKPIAWQHFGVYLGKESNIYKSIRINRDDPKGKSICLSNLLTNIAEYQGKKVKLVISMKKNKNSTGDAFIFFMSNKDQGMGYFDTLYKSKFVVKLEDYWQEFERISEIGSNDEFIGFGIGFGESVNVQIDDVKLMVKVNNVWKPIKFDNGSFEEGLQGWRTDNFSYDIKLDSTQAKSGSYSLKIKSASRAAKIGDYIKENIGNHLICNMPLALWGDRENTYPIADSETLKQLHEHLNNIPNTALNTNDITVKLANVVIAWNIFQHFYPYFDVVHVDWEKELSKTLCCVYAGKTEPDYFKALSKLVAKLEDGHGMVITDKIKLWGLPIIVDCIENKIVVTTSSDTSVFHSGDIITRIDGKSSIEELQAQESLVSGSTRLKLARALIMFGTDFSQSEVRCTLIRDNKNLVIKSKRQIKFNLFFNPLFKGYLSDFLDCGDSIYYFNNYPYEVKDVMDKMASAKGIIIGTTYNQYDLFPHIIKQSVWSPIWNVPITSYPDRKYVFFDTSGRWKIEPMKPFIKAKLIFITHPFEISEGETFLGIVNYYKLGKLVGDTSAGSNGNANYIILMGGYKIMWTGMKVLKHDGSQFHLNGYLPDYPVRRTIKAIKEDKDEYLETAKKILKEGVENP